MQPRKAERQKSQRSWRFAGGAWLAALAACIAACELSQLTFVSPRGAAAPRWMKLDQIATGSPSGMPATIDQDPPARA